MNWDNTCQTDQLRNDRRLVFNVEEMIKYVQEDLTFLGEVGKDKYRDPCKFGDTLEEPLRK